MPSTPRPLSSTHNLVCGPPLSCMTIGDSPCWNAFVTNSLATMPSFWAVAASNAAGSAATSTGTGALSAMPVGPFENDRYDFLVGRAYFELGNLERCGCPRHRVLPLP